MPCVDNKDLIYNIKELPETFSVAAGDLLLIETEEGTNIMDFNNFVIGLDNTTFGTTITQHSTDIASLSSDFDALSSELTNDVATLSTTIVGGTTKALINYVRVPTGTEKFVDLVAGSNITSVTYDEDTLNIRVNFENNLADTNYLILPNAPVKNDWNEFVQLVEIEKSTNYVDFQALNITSGSFATAASGVGFQIQTF